MRPRILVAGIGNIFLGDDGFGPEVVRHLMPQATGSPARIVDYGIRGMHLAYDLLDGYDVLILVDAIPDRGEPGTVHVIEADLENSSTTDGPDAHSMDPNAVFARLTALGGTAPPTIVVGCEVVAVDDELGLSGPVAAAVPMAVRAVHRLIADVLARTMTTSGS